MLYTHRLCDTSHSLVRNTQAKFAEPGINLLDSNHQEWPLHRWQLIWPTTTNLSQTYPLSSMSRIQQTANDGLYHAQILIALLQKDCCSHCNHKRIRFPCFRTTWSCSCCQNSKQRGGFAFQFIDKFVKLKIVEMMYRGNTQNWWLQAQSTTLCMDDLCVWKDHIINHPTQVVYMHVSYTLRNCANVASLMLGVFMRVRAVYPGWL